MNNRTIALCHQECPFYQGSGRYPMRARLVVMGFVISITAADAFATGNVHLAGFYSDGVQHQFTYRDDQIAVRAATPQFAEGRAIKDMPGLAIVPASVAVAEDDSYAGIPVEFTGTGVVGVVTREVLIRAATRQALDAALGTVASVPVVKALSGSDDIYRLTFDHPESAIAAANRMHGRPGILYAHPNFHLPVESRSNPEQEPLFGAQWNLERANIRPAWQITTGSPEVVVAVIDLGFEQNHPDLRDAWFVNPGEIPGNRIDDDGNGLKDDVSGWNYAVNGTNLIYGQNPAHGTASSGVIGARANGSGVAGICSGCRILPIVIDSEVENAVAGFLYARSFNVPVISNSWGYKIGTPRMDAVVDAITRTAADGRGGKGTSVVFAMSNFGRNDCRGSEPDISSLDAVIAVSSVDNEDRKIDVSGYGPCMEFVAPTSGSTANAVPTTDRPGEKGYNRGDNPDDFSDLDYTRTFYGTSAATPQVAGILGLMYSVQPGLTATQALMALKNGADKVHPELANYDSSGHSESYGFGRINAGRSLSLLPVR
jgi:hypothetical protein